MTEASCLVTFWTDEVSIMKKVNAIWAIPIAFVVGVSPMSAVEENNLPKDVSQEHFEAHVKNIENRLNRLGYSERTDAPKGTQASISFRLDKNGKVSNVRLIAPSGIKNFDDICLKGIEDKSPLRPFPHELVVQVVYRPKDLTLSVQIDDKIK